MSGDGGRGQGRIANDKFKALVKGEQIPETCCTVPAVCRGINNILYA